MRSLNENNSIAWLSMVADMGVVHLYILGLNT